MNHLSLISLSLCLLLIPTSSRATTAEGLLIGGFAGLTAGFISSAIAHNTRHHCHRHFYEEPVYIEQERVYVERPVVVERVVERPVTVRRRVKTVSYQQPVEMVQTPSCPAPVVQQAPLPEPSTQQKEQKAEQERALALKEQTVKLELLKEENKKRELDLKEKELALKLKAQSTPPTKVS